jgi:small-conductance mechanosensitive channel
MEGHMRDMFRTRSHAWQQAGLARQVSQLAARRARRHAAVLLTLLAGVLVVYHYRVALFRLDLPVRIVAAIVLVVVGWAFARDFGRAAGPLLFRRMDPGTAGTVGFLLRLATIGITLLIALDVVGLDARTIALGGAFSAVIFGLAAQQTLGNLIAGAVLLSARPFRVGDRVRLQGGGVGGQIEGVVSSLGLLYTTLASGDDPIMVPNNVVLAVSVTPLREPDAVDMRARLPASVRPSEVQERIQQAITVATRAEPDIELEELDGDEVVLRIAATPAHASDGPRLADEVLAAIGAFTRENAAPAGAGDGRTAPRAPTDVSSSPTN